MAEVELKFQIPLHIRSQFEQDFQQYAPARHHLYAQYFDTHDQQLQQHKIALRQRLEDKQWFQTLKAPARHEFERFELEHCLGETQPESCNFHLYQKDKQAKKILKQAIGKLNTPLLLQFETEVKRQVIQYNYQQSQIEIAFDIGEIRSGDQIAHIYEVEFELKTGTLDQLIECVETWVEPYQLWLDVRNKSERGYALLKDEQQLPVQHQVVLNLKEENNVAKILQKIVANCLTHLFPNATAIALEHYNSDHVHQARVAVRRLRSALKIFQSETKECPAEWQDQLRDIFQQLGATRDRDALAESLLPQLKQAGSPLFVLPPAPQEQLNISQLFQQPAITKLFLELLGFSQRKFKPHPSSHKTLCTSLSSLHHKICEDAANYIQLDIEARHRTRKRVKRLRYNIEFLQSLFVEQEVKAYLKALKPVQESLGHYNDLFVAEELFLPYVKKQPKAWFVLGWIKAEQQRLSAEAAARLIQFTKTGPFWS